MEKKKVYFCKVCGNVIESLWESKTQVSCCGQVMEKLEENTVDAAVEKHVPVIEKDGNKVTVKVGEVGHPMLPEHYILFVELLVGDKVYRQDFKEGDTNPQATFCVAEDGEMTARAYCNLHGFWASK